MKKQKIVLTLALAGLLMFTALGCSSQENKEQPADGDKTAAVTEEAEPVPDADGSSSLKDTEELDNEEIEQTPLEDIQGEGTPDTELPDLDSIESVPQDQEYSVTAPSGAEAYTLKIDGVSTTDERDSNNQSTPENVVVIDYTYTNSSSEPLLIDDMNFKLAGDDDIYTPYYASFLTSAELIQEGQSHSAQIAFEVGKDFKGGALVFTDPQTQNEILFQIEVK